uniref:Gag-Pol polyprotein n=1 Tax=Tanacetum cinerariifolium TaxID=118510 RepID=A0A6L2MR06_TANCI|nr:hypothetical protein [Tanacetum cinerariifolium]
MSNTLHNAIMEAGSKDHPPMLAPGNYVQWKSIIKRYLDTKPNHELIHHCLKNPSYKFTWVDKEVLISKGSPVTRTESYMETYKTVSQDIHDQLNVEAEAVQIILTGIDNDIYSIVDACPNACEIWKVIERLKQGESINVQDLETSLYWEFGKFTSQDEWQRFVTLVKQSQELKNVSYHKLYDILKQHQNEVNEIRAERITHTVNPLARVAQQKPLYHPQNHPTHYTQNSLPRSQQVAIRNRGKTIVNSPQPIYDQEPSMVSTDDHYNVFAIESEHLEQSESVHDTYPIGQDEHNVIIDSLDMSYDREQTDHNDDDNDLDNEHELLASLIAKLKCEIDDNKNHYKFLET